jgi:hypothetical protein
MKQKKRPWVSSLRKNVNPNPTIVTDQSYYRARPENEAREAELNAMGEQLMKDNQISFDGGETFVPWPKAMQPTPIPPFDGAALFAEQASWNDAETVAKPVYSRSEQEARKRALYNAKSELAEAKERLEECLQTLLEGMKSAALDIEPTADDPLAKVHALEDEYVRHWFLLWLHSMRMVRQKEDELDAID